MWSKVGLGSGRMNNLLKKIDESIEFNSKERPHLPEINIGLYIAREIIQGEQKTKIDTCVMCGEYVAEGSHVCWKCRGKISKCNVCKNKDKKICLICEHWRNKPCDTIRNKGKDIK